MRIPFAEPVSPRYITINQDTNKLRLLVPVVGGQEISTDNTCKATAALKEFFDGGALRELSAYKTALEFDIQLLPEGNPVQQGKEARLAQVNAYIDAVRGMQQSYGTALNAFLTKPSNLYSIQLKPRVPDPYSQVVNPVFNVERRTDARGQPLSALYNSLYRLLSGATIAPYDPRARLIAAVLNALPSSPSFADLQHVLTEQCQGLFGLDVNFTQNDDGTPVNQASIDAIMGFGEDLPGTTEDYIDGLLGACAEHIWDSIPAPLFYQKGNSPNAADEVERLSILTQFFLSIANTHCKARGISERNFGVILDKSPELSDELTAIVLTALSQGADVENSICGFFNAHAAEFGFSRALNTNDIEAIKQQFTRTYRTVTATKENPHMDDFMILDREAIGDTAKFVTHQGAICVNFAEIVEPALANQDYFTSVREDFAIHPVEIPHKNEWVAGDVDVDIEVLTTTINDEQFAQLPQALQDACRRSPVFQARQFLHDVAKGHQDEAEALLTANPDNTQTLLRTPGIFTDYSGRTFNCTAYEYAYWAKDTHMCRMLERHMDDETKAIIAARIDEMERIDAATGQPVGLVYSQAGQEHHSAHFDFTPLKEAYQRYLDGFDAWYAARNWAAMDAALWDVGKVQRNVPAHVAQEYCRPDRSFDPRPEFNEATLPRVLTFYNWTTGRDDSWFPLAAPNSGLGFDFALIRARGQCIAACGRGEVVGPPYARAGGAADLAAITRLDEVRTVDLTQSREHLNPPAMSQSMSV